MIIYDDVFVIMMMMMMTMMFGIPGLSEKQLENILTFVESFTNW